MAGRAVREGPRAPARGGRSSPGTEADADADDAVREAWLRASSADATDVSNLTGWLTTIVARVCLSRLESRRARRERPFAEHLHDPVDDSDPERDAVVADSLGAALLLVLDTLTPAERLAFVLHDVFRVLFDEIAPVVDRSPAAARQLAKRPDPPPPPPRSA